MDLHLGNIYQRRDAASRSVTAENPTGERGQGGRATADTSLSPRSAKSGRELGPGYKLSPCLQIDAGQTATVMDVQGPGVIRHLWIATEHHAMRSHILRVYWDDAQTPSIETPLGDFFCQGWGKPQDIMAVPINVNPHQGMNCYLPMPFGARARITIENRSTKTNESFYYTFNYTLEDVPDDALRLHAQFRRTNPVAYGEDYVMLDGVRGNGHYVGAFMCWQQNNAGWWGEGEIKMFIDGDRDHPTICGTGTEDYFGGAWGFAGRNYSAPYLGYQNTADPAAYTATRVQGSERAGSRLTLYRFHMHDPVYFKQDLRVTMQALGWRSEGRYLPLQDDISSVVYWYQSLPAAPFPELGSVNDLEIV